MVLKDATESEEGGLTKHFRDWNPNSECGTHDVGACRFEDVMFFGGLLFCLNVVVFADFFSYLENVGVL